MPISELKKKAVARQFLEIDAYYGKGSAAISICVAIYSSTYTIHTHTHIYVRV